VVRQREAAAVRRGVTNGLPCSCLRLGGEGYDENEQRASEQEFGMRGRETSRAELHQGQWYWAAKRSQIDTVSAPLPSRERWAVQKRAIPAPLSVCLEGSWGERGKRRL
jgi:hypothetical protein